MGLADDFRAQSRRNWDDRAAGWEARRDGLRSATMPVSAWMIDALEPQPGQTLLELAAGTGDTGLLAAELIAPTGTLICSDFAPEMLAGAHRRAEELGIENVRFKQIDAETSIDVQAASLDGVLCRWGYMLMADPGTALRETRRVLKPGRRVALAAWTGPESNPWSVLPARELAARGVGGPPPESDAPHQFAWADDGVIGGHLDAAGFTEHHVEALDFTFDYRSTEDWWTAQSELSGRFSAALGQAGREDVAAARAALERHAERYRADDGTLRVPAASWVAWAAA